MCTYCRVNRAAKNLGFEEKKRKFKGQDKLQQGGGIRSSCIPLTDEVVHEEEWTPQVLEERQTRLLELAADCWLRNLQPAT